MKIIINKQTMKHTETAQNKMYVFKIGEVVTLLGVTGDCRTITGIAPPPILIKVNKT